MTHFVAVTNFFVILSLVQTAAIVVGDKPDVYFSSTWPPGVTPSHPLLHYPLTVPPVILPLPRTGPLPSSHPCLQAPYRCHNSMPNISSFPPINSGALIGDVHTMLLLLEVCLSA